MIRISLRRALCAAVFCLLFVCGAAAAGDLYPVPSTGQDGVERWGYMNDNGTTVIEPAFSAADEFDACGLAAVYDNQGQAALIDEKGNVVTGWHRAPDKVEFWNGIAAFRYPDRTVYFNAKGEKIGSYPGAVGFPADERVCFAQTTDGRTTFGYYDLTGAVAIPAVYEEAGQFASRRALVRESAAQCRLIGTDGGELAVLPAGATPAYLQIYEGDVIILRSTAGKFALYSLADMRFLTGYAYDEMLPFDDNCALVRAGTLWGLLGADGKVVLEPAWPYLTHIGQGVYAARGQDAGAAVINQHGAVIYEIGTYAGGLSSFRYGLSWYGELDGGVTFINSAGNLRVTREDIEEPYILSEAVARATRNGETIYFNIFSGKVLYTTARSYELDNGIKITTERYEKYLGMLDDGSEYGWEIEYPRVSGLTDTAVETKINSAIRAFFVDGPALLFDRLALDATYGFSVEGNLLVVWASGVSDLGESAAVWNDSIALDLTTGARYTVEDDLFVDDYLSTLSTLLPQEAPFYGAPRMDATGVTFYRSYPATGAAPPYAESLHLSFAELREVIDFDGACYRALTGFSGQVYSDVPVTHWAFDAVCAVSSRGLMTGDGTLFRPSDAVSASEVCAGVARVLGLEAGELPGIEPGKWYADEVGAVYEAGLLEGFDVYWFEPEEVMTRADAMQIFANVLAYEKRLSGSLTAAGAMAELAGYADAAQVPENRRMAVAQCVRAGLVQGDERGLRPSDSFTRAEYASILLKLAQ